MNPLNILRKKCSLLPRDLLVVLGFGLLATSWSLLLLATRWPDQLLLLLSIPIIWATLHYPRGVYIPMTLIAAVASVAVTHQLSSDVSASLRTIFLGMLCLLIMEELVHALVTTRRQTEEALQQRNRELAALNAVTATINSTLEIDQVFQRLVNAVDEVFPQASAATLQLLDEYSDTMRTKAASADAITVPHEVIFRKHQGIAGLALAERRPINVADVTSDPRYLPGAVPPSYRSLLVVPLAVGQRVWGTLSLEGNAVGAFQARDEQLIQSLAQQAAIAIENAQLYQETVRRARQQATVAAITRALNASLDVEQAFPAVVKKLQLMADCERVSLFLFDAERQQFTITALTSPLPGLDQGKTLPYSTSAALSDLQAGRVHLVCDLAQESNCATVQMLTQAGFRSSITLPLLAGKQLIGAFNLYSRRPGAFNRDDLSPLQQIADAVAVSIVNSQLHEETARRLAEVHALARASTHLTADLEPQYTLAAIVEQAQAVLGADRAAVYLLDEQTQEASCAYAQGLSDEYVDAVSRLFHNIPGGPVWLEDVQTRGATGPLHKLTRHEGYRTRVVLPLSYRTRVIGALALYFDQHRAYDQALLDLAQAFANQATVALENARLFDRMRTAEAQYHGLFESSADPIAVMNADGIFIDANPAACRVWGRTHKELLGCSIESLSNITGASVQEALEQVLDGKAFTYNFSTLIEGQMHHFEARVERIDYASEVACHWTARDVTAWRELDHWREELTSIIVHNLRNPLTLIKSGAEIARMLLSAESEPDVATALDMTNKGAARLEQQIDVLLNINRAEAGQELTDQKPVSLPGLVNEVVALLGPRATAKKIQLRVELPDSLPMVSGNRNMLAWTLENLVDNALKFSPWGETITIHTCVSAASDTLCICVTDRGPGVPPADRERIFHKFYQVRRTTQIKGSGLGLFFCKLAVEAHGGQIWVKSNDDGQGSTFSFTLPL